MVAEHMWYGNLDSDEIYPGFNNEKGYWGVDFPTQDASSSKQSLFCLIQTRAKASTLKCTIPTQPYLLE